MTGIIQRVSLPGVVADLLRRVRLLEAVPSAFQRPLEVSYEIKVFGDDEIVTVGDGAFIFLVPEDIDGYVIDAANGYITTASAIGDVTVQVRLVDFSFDYLSTPITIDQGDYSSYNASVPPVLVPGQNVASDTRIAIDVDGAPGDAKGLGVILHIIWPG